jgi:hypothetical protein
MTAALLRNLDLVVLALALPVFVLAGWPLLGYLGGFVAWLAQRAIQLWTNRRARASSDPKHVAGWVTASMIGRGWLVALTIFAVGMVENDAGLAAAVLFLVVFTVSFTASMILRPFDQPRAEQPS